MVFSAESEEIQRVSEVLGDSLEFVEDLVRWDVIIVSRTSEQAVLQVFMDQGLLRRSDGAFNRLKLLRYLDTRSSRLKRCDHVGKMTVGALEAIDDLRVTGMRVPVRHFFILPPG